MPESGCQRGFRRPTLLRVERDTRMLNRRTALKSGAAALAVVAIAPSARAADAKLAALFDTFVQEDLDLSPTEATALGLDKGSRAHQRAEIDDGSLAGI